MKEQQELGIKESSSADRTPVGDYKFEPIRGQPMLRWAGKRPFTSTQFFPAQEKERHGDEVNGWMNEIYWGDNIRLFCKIGHGPSPTFQEKRENSRIAGVFSLF